MIDRIDFSGAGKERVNATFNSGVGIQFTRLYID
jgi:hypothetical protein